LFKKIAITGPESTGKSQLARQLAIHYNTIYVPEYAREYINILERPYNKQDILEIAKGQFAKEKELESKAKKYLFCDTELIVTKIWCEHKYGNCHEWILEMINKNNYDLFLLTDIDLPWQADPQREHPDLREYLFQLYKKELQKRNYNFEIVSGFDNQRIKNAIDIIDNYFRH